MGAIKPQTHFEPKWPGHGTAIVPTFSHSISDPFSPKPTASQRTLNSPVAIQQVSVIRSVLGIGVLSLVAVVEFQGYLIIESSQDIRGLGHHVCYFIPRRRHL